MFLTINRFFRRLSTIATAFILLIALPVEAQEEATLVERGLLAYSSRNYANAVGLLEQAISEDPTNAEAHYHLGRVLFDEENPNRDLMRARSEISRAEDLEPQNVLYKMAKLEHLRVRQWNFFENFLRQRQRLDLAKDILELDPNNALAHEELGEQSIRDYYVYHNAVSLPTVQFHSKSYDFEIESDEGTQPTLPGPDGEIPEGEDNLPLNPQTSDDFFALEGSEGTLGRNEFAVGDRFSIVQIAAQGGPSIDMRRRAEAAYERAIDHLEKALEQDPRRRAVYDHLIRLAAIEGRYEDIMDPLGEMLFHFGEEAETWLYTGLANHRMGNDEAADKAFREALDRMPPEQRAVFEDIDAIRAPGEPELTSEVEEAAFWTSRNPRYLTTYNERKIEHYARLTYADLMYASDKLGLRGWETERGEIHVRYGVPEENVMITGNFQQALESYDGRNERVGTRMGTDGELERSESRERLFSQLNRFNIWDYGNFKFVFQDPNRNGEFSLYAPPADMHGVVGQGMTNADNMDYVIRTRETIRETPDRYDYEAPGRQVELPYRLAAFRGESGNADVYLNYGIPLAGEVGANRRDVDITVHTGAFLISEDYELPVQRRRTIYGLKGSQIVEFDSLRLWANTEELVAAPGSYQVSLEFETSDRSTLGVQRRDIDVPDFSGEGLQMSEILLAYSVEPADSGQPGAVFRDGLLIRPAPWGVYRTTDPIYLYFEMYGLGMRGSQTNYEVEAELRPKDTRGGIGGFIGRVFGGREPGVSNAFPVQADRRDDSQYVILDATGQEPGLYTLTVTITDHVSGQSVERETELFLE